MIYDDDVVGFVNGLNFLSGVGHLALAIAIGVVGDIGLRPNIYMTETTFTQLLPASAGFQTNYVVNVYGTLPLTILTVTSYAISSFFAFGNVFLWPEFHLTQLEKLASPVRWTSHIVSSAFLIIVVAYIAGVRSLLTLLGVVSMQITGKLLLALTEQYSRPEDEENYLMDALLRAKPHLISFIPFAFEWVVILMQFAYGTSCLAPPAVWAIVFCYFGFSTFFYLPQAFQILNLPTEWVSGEWKFILLEVAMNVTTAILLLLAVLRHSDFADSLVKNSPDASCLT